MVDKIKIGDQNYSVRIDRGLVYDTDNIGQIDYRKAKIRVAPELSEQLTHNVLVHEAIHGMMYFMGFVDHEEDTVIRIANGLCMLIKDNPKLFSLK